MVFYDLKGKGISLFSFFIFVILFLPFISSSEIKIGIDSNPQPIINNNDSTGLNIGIDSGKINYYHYGTGGGNGTTINNYYNVTGGNGTADYTNVALINQSATWTAGTNVSTGIGGWFKGAFNWVISSLTPSNYATFNGTTLWINTTYFYNMTVAGASGFNATYDAHINNLTLHNNTYWYNQTIENTTYHYNQTIPANAYTNSYIAGMNNTWSSTYNATYAQYAYNQTSTGDFVKKTGDVMTGSLKLGTGAYVESNESGSYFGYTRENKFVYVYKGG